MTAIERAQAAARLEYDLREDLASYHLNVRLGRVERDDVYEQRLRDQITEAEQAWRDALAARKLERTAA
jgi:hypothetical protein